MEFSPVMSPPSPEYIEEESSTSSTHPDLVQSLDRIDRSLDLEIEFEKKILVEEINLNPDLPDYDRGLVTRRLCIVGLVGAWIAIISCLVLGGIITARVSANLYQTDLTWTSGPFVSLAVNIFVVFITDAMGYIHGVSLRWALYREDRLHFNTNLRLFRSARNYVPNMWPLNILWIVSLVTCYAASSEMIIEGELVEENVNDDFSVVVCSYVNGIALLAMAIGLSGMAMSTTWVIIFGSEDILTWSSNPLNNTLVLLHHTFHKRRGRCMSSVASIRPDSKANKPRTTETCASASNATIKYVILILWIWPLVVLIWFVLLVILTRKQVLYAVLVGLIEPISWSFSFSWVWAMDIQPINALDLFLSSNDRPWAAQLVLGLLVQAGIQGAHSIGTHSIELIANVSRDEQTWRTAANLTSRTGACKDPNALKSVMKSWPSILFFLFKALSHWTLGQSLALRTMEMRGEDPTYTSDGHEYTFMFSMMYMRVFVYGIIITTMVGFATFLAFRKPKGPQPVAYGHFQTLADLIDDWRVDSKGNFWWGDKGVAADGIRHAGTSCNKQLLGEIHMDALYE
jgi:hypothetical protein